MTTATKTRPIIMGPESVPAILDGRKTQTRRVVKPQPVAFWDPPGQVVHGLNAVVRDPDADNVGKVRDRWLTCPYGVPGDQLWVREAHAIVPATAYAASHHSGQPIPHAVSPDGTEWAVYRAGWSRCAPGLWRSPIHMPRWAPRITLEVTEVRVERLQEITAADAIAEGVQAMPSAPAALSDRTSFSRLWDTLNANRGHGWDENPWVWVISFRRVEP